MKMIDVKQLINWLGSDGAIAGLECSDLTVSDLHELASSYGIAVEKKMRRSDIINELINRKFVKIDLEIEELLSMNYEALKKYLEESLRNQIDNDLQILSEETKDSTNLTIGGSAFD